MHQRTRWHSVWVIRPQCILMALTLLSKAVQLFTHAQALRLLRHQLRMHWSRSPPNSLRLSYRTQGVFYKRWTIKAVLKPKTKSLFRSDHREVKLMLDVSNDDLLDWYFAELIKELIFCKAVLEIWFDLIKKKKKKILQSEHILQKVEKNDHYFK